MSETPESRSSLPEKQRGRPPRPHKYTLEPLQNGHLHEAIAPHVSALPDIAGGETAKLAALDLNGRTHQQDGKPTGSASPNGHPTIEEAETRKLAAALETASKQRGSRAPFSQRVLVYTVYPLRQLIRLRRYSLLLFASVLLVPLLVLLVGGVLEYVQLQQPFDNLYAVDALSGTALGQLPVTAPIQPLAADDRGSLVSVTIGQHLQQLAAYSLNGAPQWQTLTTAFAFSVPAIASHPGSVLVVTDAKLPPGTGSEAGSMRPLALYQVNRATGAVIWQKTIMGVSDQAGAAILGADQRAVYVAVVQADSQANVAQPVVVLQAINQDTGAVIWSVAGPTAANEAFQDAGQLLLSGSTAFWQVGGNIYAIDSLQGRVQWSRLITENGNQTLLAEESHMIVVGNSLIVERSIMYHALDIANGAEQWDISNPRPEYGGQPPSSYGIAAAGNTLLLYGGGQIEAVDVITRQVLWTQKQLNSIQRVIVSRDGTLAYVVLTASVEGSQPAQALAALDMRNGGARWTFQLSAQMTFLPLLPDGIVYTGHVLLATICPSQQAACTQPFLYALNPTSGAILWKVGGNSISNISLSAAGDIVIFQRQSTGWLDLTERFRN